MIINMNGIECEIHKSDYCHRYHASTPDGTWYEVENFEEALERIKQGVQEGYEEFGVHYFESFFEAGGHIVCDYDEF